MASLRAIARATGAWDSLRDPEIRTAAGSIAWAFRSLSNTPDVVALIRGMGEPGLSYWRQVFRYCLDGCLQAVLDAQACSVVGGVPPKDVAGELSQVMGEAISLRTSNVTIDEIDLSSGEPEIRDVRLRMSFAINFMDGAEIEEQVESLRIELAP